MDYGRLMRFARRHGNVAVFDDQGGTHRVHDATRDSQALVKRADRFLWDGLMRSAAEMENLVAQSERGLAPGCAECEKMEKELVAAREEDRRRNDLEGRLEAAALKKFQEHRESHE